MIGLLAGRGCEPGRRRRRDMAIDERLDAHARRSRASGIAPPPETEFNEAYFRQSTDRYLAREPILVSVPDPSTLLMSKYPPLVVCGER
jgi:hypothetical protein